jgi:iron complex transport system permease protein
MTVSDEPSGWRARPASLLLISSVLLVVCTLFALRIGAVDIPLRQVIAIIASLFGAPLPADVTSDSATVLLSIRLPRIVLAIVAGAGLSASGAALQAMFRNPLADPMLIGVSSGAALAVTATIVVGSTIASGYLRLAGPLALPLAGFVGGLAATLLLYRIATFEGATSLATMLLAGIAINALAFAGIGLLTTIASNEQLRSISFWNFGSLAGAGWDTVGIVAIAVLLSIAWLIRMAPGLNAFALGEIEARHLGFSTERLKRGVIALAALMAGFIVAICGVIGFIALVAPHIARTLGGVDNRAVIPVSAVIGAILLLGGDMLGRLVVAPAELPIGIVTALVGAPFFLWLLLRRRGQVE